MQEKLLWNLEEACTSLGLDPSTLRDLVQHSGAPHIRVGVRIWFYPAVIRGWLERHRIPHQQRSFPFMDR